jgi:hypothetical protein
MTTYSNDDVNVYITSDRVYAATWVGDNSSIIGFKIGEHNRIIYNFNRGYSVSHWVVEGSVVFKGDKLLYNTRHMERREVKVPDLSVILRLLRARYEVFTDLSHLSVPVKSYEATFYHGRIKCQYHNEFGVHGKLKIVTDISIIRVLIYYNFVVLCELNGDIYELPDNRLTVSKYCMVKENFVNYIDKTSDMIIHTVLQRGTVIKYDTPDDLVELHKRSIMFPKMVRGEHYADVVFV